MDGTNSITHSVALAPAFLGNVARRAWSSGTTSGASSLAVAKPLGTAQNDRLLAQVVVAGGPTTTVVAPGWTLVNSRDAGTALKSLIYQRPATGTDTSYTFSFMNKQGSDATGVVREAAVGIAAYSGVAASGGINNTALDANPCGGETPVLLLSWSDRHFDPSEDVDLEVSYNATTVGDETHLVRRRCTAPSGTDLSGLPSSQQTLATHLAPATAFASCVSTTAPAGMNACLYLPVTVTMSLTEPPEQNQSIGRTYLLRASTRTDREED